MMNIGAHIVVWWMALLMIALPMVPHHHHQGTVCVVMERCQSDGAINDQHRITTKAMKITIIKTNV